MNGEFEDNDNFWETKIFPLPELYVSYQSPKTMLGYTISSGESYNRMPKNWIVYASNDQNTWVSLYKTSKDQIWTNFEKKEYKLNNKKLYRFYKFKFIGFHDESNLRIYQMSFKLG